MIKEYNLRIEKETLIYGNMVVCFQKSRRGSPTIHEKSTGILVMVRIAKANAFWPATEIPLRAVSPPTAEVNLH